MQQNQKRQLLLKIVLLKVTKNPPLTVKEEKQFLYAISLDIEVKIAHYSFQGISFAVLRSHD